MKKPKKICVVFKCHKAVLIPVKVGQSLQTQNGFFISKVHGLVCPVCAGCY